MNQKNTNIKWHEAKINTNERLQFLKQKGGILWFTGLSGSGKSTLATEVEVLLIKQGIFATILDGDNIRHGLNKDLGFSDSDRQENIRRIAEVAKLFCNANVFVLTAFISPFKADRNFARNLVEPGQFIEVFCNASVEDCEKRDPKGLYAKARKGQIADFTGISSPYEAPENPEISVHTTKDSIRESALQIINYLKKEKLIP